MRILVCFKIVPNWDKILEEDWEKFTVKTDVTYAGIQYNCFDEAALEHALRLKDILTAQEQDVFCAAITIGGTLPESFSQGLYAAGYDQIVKMDCEGIEFNAENAANQLAEYAKAESYDLILTGCTVGMADSGTVPFLMAEKLSFPLLAEALTIELLGENLVATCQELDGLWQYTVRPPLIITIGNSPAVLRAVTLRSRLTAKEKTTQNILPLQSMVKNKLEFSLSRPKSSRQCHILPIGTHQALAATLLDNFLKMKTDTLDSKPKEKIELSPNSVVYSIPESANYCTIESFDILMQDWQSRKPKIAILPDTVLGRSFAVKLATRFGICCKTGVMLGAISETTATLHKKVCASNLAWTQKMSYPFIITMTQPPTNSEKLCIPYNDNAEPKWLIAKDLIDKPIGNNLQNCDIIIACGLGIGSKDACEKARYLASVLGVGFGLTRPAALNGWGSSAEILGQSGVVAHPKICFALGISGACAFMSGVEAAEKIIAVNTDCDALIFKHADIGIYSDAPKLVDAFIEQLFSREA